MKIMPNMQALQGLSTGVGSPATGANPSGGAASKVFAGMLESLLGSAPNGPGGAPDAQALEGDFVNALAKFVRTEMGQGALGHSGSATAPGHIPLTPFPEIDTTLTPEMPMGAFGALRTTPTVDAPQESFAVTSPHPQAVEAGGIGSVQAAPPEAMTPPAPEKTGIDRLVDLAAERFGLDPALIRSVIQVESSGDPNAVSRAGAQGLMQLMPATATELGVTDAFDPEQNVMGGAGYLKKLLDRYHGKLELALAAYNWGPGNLERKSPDAMPTETRNYIAKVSRLMNGAENERVQEMLARNSA